MNGAVPQYFPAGILNDCVFISDILHGDYSIYGIWIAWSIFIMASSNQIVKDAAEQEYKYGFVTDIEEEFAPPGLNEDTIRFISAKKNEPEWMLEWRMKAYHYFMSLVEKDQLPEWANIQHKPINFQDIIYYSAPKVKETLGSLDEVDP
jgi:Fe-S cluster assembly protein SufB